MERDGRLCPATDREDLWHLEEELRLAADALARAGQSRPAGTADRDGLQPAPPWCSSDCKRRELGTILPGARGSSGKSRQICPLQTLKRVHRAKALLKVRSHLPRTSLITSGSAP